MQTCSGGKMWKVFNPETRKYDKFTDYHEARRVEDERLYGTKLTTAQQRGKPVILSERMVEAWDRAATRSPSE